MEAEELRRNVKATFGDSLRALSTNGNLDTRATLRVSSEPRPDGTIHATLFTNASISYELHISSVEESGGDWRVHTTNRGELIFRRLTEDEHSAYKHQLKKDRAHG